jgi:receptor expression-enhancing protein 5/6
MLLRDISTWLANDLVTIIKVAYPTYQSYKALNSAESDDDTTWLIYWVSLAIWSFVEAYLLPFVSWVPFFMILRLLLILWLQAPIFNGSVWIFRKVIQPCFEENEKTMKLVTGGDRASVEKAAKSVVATYEEILRSLSQPDKGEKSSPSEE